MSALTSSLEASRANRSPQRLGDGALPLTSGRSCGTPLSTSDQGSSLQRTFKKNPLSEQEPSWPSWVTEGARSIYQRLVSGLTIKEAVGGFVHTPTTKANFTCRSMQKWPGCRRYVEAFGGLTITPEQFEFLMGYPVGWTDLSNSETQ